MFELILWPEAEVDIAEAQKWYENRREGLGDDFEACLDEAFEKLLRYPTVFGIVYSGLRRFQVRRFPYGIYFDVIDDDRRGCRRVPRSPRFKPLGKSSSQPLIHQPRLLIQSNYDSAHPVPE